MEILLCFSIASSWIKNIYYLFKVFCIPLATEANMSSGLNFYHYVTQKNYNKKAVSEYYLS